MEQKHDPKKGKGYEERDANAKGVSLVLAAIAFLIVGAMIVAYVSMVFLSAKTKQEDGDLPPMFQTQVNVPEPRLQVAPVADLKAIRAEEEKILTTYGWVDAGAQIVRIPESKAMELILKQGLPYRKSQGAAVKQS